jgi:hypothetical protein
VTKQALYEKLELEANRGATLRDLVAEIDKASQLLTEVQRGEAWLYAWALVKRHESRLLMARRNGKYQEEDYDEGTRSV